MYWCVCVFEIVVLCLEVWRCVGARRHANRARAVAPAVVGCRRPGSPRMPSVGARTAWLGSPNDHTYTKTETRSLTTHIHSTSTNQNKCPCPRDRNTVYNCDSYKHQLLLPVPCRPGRRPGKLVVHDHHVELVGRTRLIMGCPPRNHAAGTHQTGKTQVKNTCSVGHTYLWGHVPLHEEKVSGHG